MDTLDMKNIFTYVSSYFELKKTLQKFQAAIFILSFIFRPPDMQFASFC